jgi:coproporphyrinogen III oxidase
MDIKIKKKLVKNWFISLQEIICSEIIKIEKKNAKFKTKEWKRNDSKDEGGGKSRVLENGDIFDKVGVNFSEVYGKFSKEFKNKIPGTEKVNKFWASGISIVMHMKNPHVPAIHFNTRYIYTDHGWFGGGIDVTPCFNDKNVKKILFKELKKVCDRQNKNSFKKYKKWCDEYFYLPHRKEARGIGGIFFDYKKDNWKKDFSFVRELGVSFIKIFNKIISARKNKKWNKSQKNIQFLKRGRYVEFNLLYDRGTKFGLQTGGNVEAILMSLPPTAKWK